MKIKDKVLLIEDERTIRGFMQAILTANGYDVLMAGTGAMANTMISSHCPDLIILDLGLPDMDGMTILRSVREWSKVPILVVSARSHERDKVEALDAGADDYLTFNTQFFNIQFSITENRFIFKWNFKCLSCIIRHDNRL